MGLIVTRLTSLVYKRASSLTHPQLISRKSIFEVLHPAPLLATPQKTTECYTCPNFQSLGLFGWPLMYVQQTPYTTPF